MHYHAEKLIVEAEDFHKLNNGNLPEFIYSLRELTDVSTTDDFLRRQYQRIFSRPPESLIKIIPDNINQYKSLDEFILSEIVSGAKEMLTCINSISEVKKEDKYSDLLVLAINSRIRNYSWHIGPARGGYSDSDKPNPGEIDFAISTQKERITICEAMILTGKNITETQKHNFKIFNYDPTRNYLYVITYYTGNSEKYLTYWNQYKMDISSIVSFPLNYQMTEQYLTDISDTFGNDCIKVGVGKHSNNMLLYHLFININYRVFKSENKKSKRK